MATLREVIIKVSADSGSFQSEIARASRMGLDYSKIIEQGGKQAAAVTRETQRSIAALNTELVSAKATATGLAGVATNKQGGFDPQDKGHSGSDNSESARWTQRVVGVKESNDQVEALKQLTEAVQKFDDEANTTMDTAGLSDRQRQRYGEEHQIKQTFEKAGGNNSNEARTKQDAALTSLNKKYKAIEKSEGDWRNGVSRGYYAWLEEMSNISGTVSDGVKSSLNGAFSNVTSMLEGNKVSWKSWGISILQILEKVALQMAAVSLLGGSSSSSGGLLGTIVGGFAGFFGGSAASNGGTVNVEALQGYADNLQFFAKGGVQNSPSLSAYSNGVYSTPKTFAFAKDTGVFGEAGPEAIMPLTRASDGSLGVRAVSSDVNNVQTAGGSPQVYITIEGNGNTSVQAGGGMTEQFGKEIGSYVERRYRELMARDIAPGGAVWNLAKGGR
ncbi:phage tail tape measure protein [Phytobacter diazotrophicus]|uniref:phage tail tape measure protein n=1 Tax=Phytobacter diazotrophicus TaxID=395631 RepID=UPI002FF68741